MTKLSEIDRAEIMLRHACWVAAALVIVLAVVAWLVCP